MFFGMMAFVPKAEAQTAGGMSTERQQELLALISQLQEKVLILQRKIYENKHQSTTNIIHGNSYVEVTRTALLYKEPGRGTSVGKQSRGADGDVSGGPRLINGEVWWKIAFTGGDEGWVKEKYLKRIPSVGIYSDVDGDGKKELVQRVIGDYDSDRFILFPYSDGIAIIYIKEEMAMLGSNEDAYIAGQVANRVSGPPFILQSNPYPKAEPFVKGVSKAVPIAWEAKNIPMNAEVEVEVTAVRLVDSPHSGGVWAGKMLTGDSISRYFWDIDGVGQFGAGDYKSQVRVKQCSGEKCSIIAESPYRYFSIVNP